MRTFLILISAVLPFFITAVGQTLSATPTPRVRAVGTALIPVTPDQAKVDAGVVTQAASAQDASTQNATKVAAVLAALQQLLGTTANIQTVSYSLSPNYTYPPGGGQPTLTGYTASNTIEVTTSDLSSIGKVIDTAIQAGANTIQSLQFGLQNDQPAQAQALKAATQEAKMYADAIASGLGLHAGSAVLAQQGTAAVSPVVTGIAASSTTTPIQSGMVTVSATVTVEFQLVP